MIGGRAHPRVRSISMNGNMNGNSWYTDIIRTKYFTFRKYSEIVRPSPSQAFVFIDERPEDIDDGYFLVFLDREDAWGNMPAIYHNGACGFSFAMVMRRPTNGWTRTRWHRSECPPIPGARVTCRGFRNGPRPPSPPTEREQVGRPPMDRDGHRFRRERRFRSGHSGSPPGEEPEGVSSVAIPGV